MEGSPAQLSDDQSPFFRYEVTVGISEHFSDALGDGPEGGYSAESIQTAIKEALGGSALAQYNISVGPLEAEIAAGVNVQPLPVDITDREQDVLALMGQGLSNADIGQALSITESTVKGHVTRLLAKLDARNRVQAALIWRGPRPALRMA